MEYSADSDMYTTWSCRSNSMYDMDDDFSVVVKSDRRRYLEVSDGSVTEPSVTLYDDPTYANLSQAQPRPVPFHFGDRFKGLFMFLRETNTSRSTIVALQDEVERLLNNRTNCDLATSNLDRFSTDIIIFGTMIDDRLRRIRRRSEDEFVAVSNKLTKLEKGARTRIYTLPSLATLRKLVQRIFSRKASKI